VSAPAVEIIPAIRSSEFPVPAIIAAAGDKASEHFLEFFAATIRNKNTRAAYVQAIAQFCRWCEEHDLRLATIRPLHVSAYIEAKKLTAPSIKQHLAALRGLFNWLVIKQVVPENPAMFVKGPRFSRQVGITPIMEAEQMRQLLDSIPITRKIKVPKKHGGGCKDVPDIKGLRDRAIIAIMGYTFGRVSAVIGAKRGDYRHEGKRARLRLLEKGNKEKLVWLHREAEEFLDTYIAAACIEDKEAPLFQSVDKAHRLMDEALDRRNMLRAVKPGARWRDYRRSSVIIHSGARASRYFCITAGRSKPRRIWRTIPIRAPPSSMTGVRIWRRSVRSSAGSRLSSSEL
jgi:integrase/recombinase XerD